MIPKSILTLFLSVALSGCHGQNTAANPYAEADPLPVRRFDRTLFQVIESGDPAQQTSIRGAYPAMLDVVGKGILNMQTPDAPEFFGRLIRFYSEPTLKGLYRDALAAYDSIADIERQLGQGFAYLQASFPAMTVPAVYMHVSGFNQNVLAGDSLLSVSIDKYLGEDYPLYQDFFYDYQRRKMQRSLVVPDYLAGWLMSEHPFTGKENILLDRMIYEGKLKYLVAHALPETTPRLLMGYTEAQEGWCRENEAALWRAIVERKHLYTPDRVTTARYFEDHPCTFLANKAPGNLGTWVGWQIVDKYMEATNATPETLMQQTDAQEILRLSGYKPD